MRSLLRRFDYSTPRRRPMSGEPVLLLVAGGGCEKVPHNCITAVQSHFDDYYARVRAPYNHCAGILLSGK